MEATYQVENGHFHHTLIEIGCAIFDDLDSYHFLGFEILTLDDLAESTLTQHIQDEISVPENSQSYRFLYVSWKPPQSSFCLLVASFLRSKNVVDIENVVTVLIVITVVLDSLTRFCENSARIA
jgi:hypothetical protein